MPAALPPPTYLHRTREASVNVLFLLPLFLLYELSLFGTRSPVQNAAGAWIRSFVTGLGSQGLLLLLVGTLAAIALLLLHLRRSAPRDGSLYGGMVLEGLVYGAVLGTVAALLASALPLERFHDLPAPESVRTADAPAGMHRMRLNLQTFGLALGAGLFEELVFRGVLLGGLVLTLRHAVGCDRWLAALVALPLTAYLFSDYHHWGLYGETYDAGVFAFRFHAGLVLGAIFLTRGLGIAVLAHGFYDCLVMLG